MAGKTLLLLNGPMGVGKSTVSRLLLEALEGCFFLDGDWCWTMHPFVVDEETQALVLDNIVHTLGGFLRCSRCRTALLCWVLDREETVEALLERLPLGGCRVCRFTLTASPEALAERIGRDVAAGLRDPGTLARSLERLPRYEGQAAAVVDTSNRTPRQVAAEILRRLAEETA